jgi:two-component system, sensor histidine kinase and response regulator
LHFSITDTGVGVPLEKQEKVFAAFTQADGSTTRKFGGTGLGLTISTRLVQLMGGRIWVESKTGQGSTFHFTTVFQLAKGQAPQVLRSEPNVLQHLPVLVVDDNATKRHILEEMLAHWGMAPTSVAGARSALLAMEQARASGRPFPLVLLDGHMPEVDGFTLAQQIKGSAEFCRATIMMLTSDRQLGDAARCREMGIAVHLVKPIAQSELLDAILLALGGRREVLETATEVTVASVPADQRKLRVLLAEDNAVNQTLAVRLLERLGHVVVVAHNGREAVEELEKWNYEFDVVLMDVQMPEMDGFEATAAIRARDQARGAHTPIVAMTAHAMKGDRERCLEAGMDGYVSKPIRIALLMEEIGKHLRAAPAEVPASMALASTAR